MVAIQIGIIVFLLFVLAILYHDEYRKGRLSRKSARLNRFWHFDRERRKNVRINTEIDVLYEVSNSKANHRRLTSKSRNISIGGVNLALNEKLFPGTQLSLQLDVPKAQRPILVQGEIVWVKEIPAKFAKEARDRKERFFATGVKFVQVKPEDETKLREFINERIKVAPEEITPYIP